MPFLKDQPRSTTLRGELDQLQAALAPTYQVPTVWTSLGDAEALALSGSHELIREQLR